MNPEDLAKFPARPASIAEWEDLLVRLEIMPRAVSGTLDGPVSPATPGILQGMVNRERMVAMWLEGVATTARKITATTAIPSGDDQDFRSLADRFASLRSRNFAMVQRRGLDVWEWTGAVAGGAPASVHQVLEWLLASDAAALVSLRSALPSAPGSIEGSVC